MAKFVGSGGLVSLSKEAGEQYDIASKAIGKLADISGKSWHLITHSCYKKEIGRVCFITGMVCTLSVVGLSKLYTKIQEKHKTKNKEENK